MNLPAVKNMQRFPVRGIGMLSKWVSKTKAGSPPGTPVFIGEQKTEEVTLSVIDYSEKECNTKEVEKATDLQQYRDSETVSWINVNGIHDVEVISRIGQDFNIHPLVQEDIVNTSQRPKAEEYDAFFYLVLRMLQYNADSGTVDSEQISMVLGPGVVITFQERQGDVFDAIRDRITNDKGRIRKKGADYLFYALLDAVMDGYFIILEQLGEPFEALEARVINDPNPATLAAIHDLRSQISFLRKSVWPLREAVGLLQKTESPLIQNETRLFLRDVNDHAFQLVDTLETFRDAGANLFEMYLSMVSNRTNEVMKVLTIIATIFIPLTFVAGIYGMNFEYMPELKTPWGYPAALGLMLAIAFAMLLFFRKKKWL
ncbi:MAG: magnesium/cobalt transporter CorA [Lentisphaeria bacterium]